MKRRNWRAAFATAGLALVLSVLFGGCSDADGPTPGCRQGRCSQVEEDGGPEPRGTGGARWMPAPNGGTGGAAIDASAGDSGDASRSDGVADAEPVPERDGGVRTACRADPTATPKLPPSGTLDAELVARAGAVFGSCWLADGVARITEAMVLASSRSAAYWSWAVTQAECLANASCGCDAVEHCLGSARDFTGGPCESSTPTCTGEIYRGCARELLMEIDCGKLGLQCDLDAICVEQEATRCDAAAFVRACTADGRATACRDGVVRHGPPCESMGLVCRDGACVGGGGACSETSPSFDGSPAGIRCLPDGVTLEACWGGGVTQIDCGTRGAGFACQTPREGSPFCGVAAECLPPSHLGADTTACDGHVLRFCNAGRIERVDCKSLGFGACDLNDSLRHFGCVHTECGNGIREPGEQCDYGDDLPNCVGCVRSCETDEHCWWPEQDQCQKYACQDKRCVQTGPRSDGTSCSRDTRVSLDFGACTAGVCEFPATCEGTLYGQTLHSYCNEVDSNFCNGVPECTSPSAPRGSCAGSSPPLRPGAFCGDGDVCDTNHRCVRSKCGDGVIDAETGEQCDPPDDVTCGGSCRRR